MTKPTGISRTARWFFVVAGVFALLVVTAVVAFSIYVSRAREAREAALDAIRRRGEPVFVEDLVEVVPRGDPKTMEWVLAFEEIPDPWKLGGEPEEGESEEAFLARVREAGASAGDLALIREWRDCLEVEPEVMDYTLYWDELEQTLRDLPSPEDVTPCQIVAIKSAMWFSPQALEHARLAGDLGPVDVRGELERLKARTPDGELEIFPRDAHGLIWAVQNLSNAAVIANLEGDPEEALHLLELAFHTVELWRGQPYLIGHLLYCTAIGSAGEGLERVLPYLPEDADLTKIEAFYESFDPRADLHQALLGERAFVNRTFQRLRDGEFAGGELGGRPRSSPFEWLVLDLMVDVNQTTYLELVELALAECAKPRFDRTSKIDGLVTERLDGGWDTLFTSMILPKFSSQHASALHDEVCRDFALAAIRAHRDGIEVARAEIASRIDPFSGEPYHTRVEPDGTFVMWSVGEDGEDDDARGDEEREDGDDVGWRYRPWK